MNDNNTNTITDSTNLKYIALDGVITFNGDLDYMQIIEDLTEWLNKRGHRYDGSFYEAFPKEFEEGE